MNITKLNKPFVAQTVLTAAQLNSITDTIDLIIDNWPTVTPSGDPDDDNPNDLSNYDDIVRTINDAKQWINGKISDILTLVSQFDQGSTHIRTDEEMLDLFKGEMGKALLVHYGICDSNGNPFFNALVDRNGVKPAAIIASIRDQNGNLTSEIGISASNVIIDGNTTLTGKLSAIEGTISSLNVPDTATIKNAVIQDLLTNNITITGTLNYNRLVGNVTTVNAETNWSIPNDVTYVRLNQFASSGRNLITFPANPIEGQTIYVESAEGVSILPVSGTALLAGWVYSHTEEIPYGNGSDTETVYVYKWGLVQYTAGQFFNYNVAADYNLRGNAVHSYIYTGQMWVETTALQQRSVTLTYAQKQQYGL